MLERAGIGARKLGLTLHRLAEENRILKQGNRWLATRYGRVAGTGIIPENIIWIFGSARSGSTWLRNMMKELAHHQLWEEPLVGQLFGDFRNRVPEVELRRHDFIMSEVTREGWIRAIRNFVLDCASYSRPTLSSDDYLVIKEPNGSIGAPLMMEALPESRMILLARDPRDVIASSMDARREGGWNYERNKKLYLEGRKVSSSDDPNAFAAGRAKRYLEGMGKAKEAYDAHEGKKVFVRYEELRADALGTMGRMYSELGIPVDEGELERVVEKHSWENIPEEEKGEGKFYRKATPGSWREDLTPEQAAAIERVTAPLMKELYPYEALSEDLETSNGDR